jgi:hypothetical protein
VAVLEKVTVVVNDGGAINDAAVTEQDDGARLPCYHCGESYASANAARHTEPVSCDVCPRCTAMPACYTCRNMYCPCAVHQY